MLLPLLKSDLYDILVACVEGNLKESLVSWLDGFACTVVCAAPGYPNAYPKGSVIHGIDEANALIDVQVYQAGTVLSPSGATVTNGGRVLAVTGVGASLEAAVETAYKGVNKLCFDGMHYRKDIAKR